MDDDWHNGDAHLKRDVEPAFFKLSEFSTRGSGALGSDHQGFLLIAHGGDERFHGFDGFFAIGPINENDAREPHRLPYERHIFNFFFTHANHITTYQTRHDGHICFALVVKHEYSWSMAPQIFLPIDLQLQADQGATRVCKK